VIEVHDITAGLRTDGVLIRCDGATAAGGLARSIALALDMGHNGIVVDLGDRPSACAALLSVLRRCGQRLRAEGGHLAVVCLDRNLRRLLDLTLLSNGFAVYATRDEALGGAGG
jgi:anti-anti-sigma regulatory factor